MKAFQRLQIPGSLGIAICLFALVINSYILLTIQRSLNFDHLRGLFHENMNKFVLTMKTEMTHLDSRMAMRALASHQDQDINSLIKLQEVETALTIDLDDDKDAMPFLLQRNITPSFTLGSGHSGKVSLVIGVPSVKRVGASYLHTTVESLLKKIYPTDEKDTSIVVFLAEEDKQYIKQEAGYLYENFTREFESGLLQVIGPPDDFYPNFDYVQQTLGDPANRVKWRSKEVVDAALLMFLCRHKAEYYVMLEDDVIAARGYSAAIQRMTETHTSPYIYLSVANLNSIGKIFKTSDIPKWSSYLLTFYYDKPIDWLMKDYVKLISCNDNTNQQECDANMKEAQPILSYSVFQHIGKKSSLPGKLQTITDPTFDETAAPRINHENEPATISVSPSLSNKLRLKDVESWYFDNGGMNKHIAVKRLASDDAITVSFDESLAINRILVKTGRTSRGQKMMLCESCMSIEILTTNVHQRTRTSKDLNYHTCTYADHSGTMECKPPVQISSFRLIAHRAIAEEVWFDLIYVEV